MIKITFFDVSNGEIVPLGVVKGVEVKVKVHIVL